MRFANPEARDSSLSVATMPPPMPKGNWDELFAGCKKRDMQRQKPVGGEHGMAHRRNWSNGTI